MEFDLFANLIRETSGLVIKPEDSPNLDHALNSRMKMTGIVDANQYLDFIRTQPGELNKLIDLVTNNETYFFREPNHFKICVEHLIPDFLKKGNLANQKIKILSAGCSTGEEPYSIAISLVDRFGPEILDSVSIVGVDINENAVRSAKKAIFTNHSFRDTEPSYQKNYFHLIFPESYQLKSSIRNAVEFHAFNLSQTKSYSWLSFFDIIFYRNVSIYFNQETKNLVFKELGDRLKDDGCIIMGSAESISNKNANWFLEELMGGFVYRKFLNAPGHPKTAMNFFFNHTQVKNIDLPKQAQPIPDNQIPFDFPPERRKKRDTKENLSSLFHQSLVFANQKHYVQALTCLDKLIFHDPQNGKALNLKTAILINIKRLSEAKEICDRVFKMDEWNLECRLLSGIIARMERDNEKAIHWFKSVSYLQPSCWFSQMHLGELYESQDETKGAIRAYKQALKHLKINGVKIQEFSFFPLKFSQEQLIHFLNHKLVSLKKNTVHS